ncbi:Arf-GAP domain and FG repeat-containing protein 1 [Oryzias melastigma]|uniref:Arf-GAP domain and FG repeat-containing protein 1 n=1 Tax=Oryzias melastigma TaxID=30732 RepID=A0A834FDV5_ORYME|nr:Arf-GAP domain and FG repeat-containing protein 1 [Oryzias melastigma]
MATSAKRKQEETHLKMLREMTSLPANRKCFDCDQRGPTYVNMTVGSFVCTTCSGILRGLNPPHRVKSISMTTFTQQEIEFLQKHSNEVCKQIWLGLYDDRTLVVPDFREPQKVKEFLQEKYEKKRWYVPPDQAKTVASVHGPSMNSTGSPPEVHPLKSLQLNKTPLRQSPGLSRSQALAAAQDKKFDLLSDLGGDIFAAPPTQTVGSTNFANFAQFPSQSGGGVPVPSVCSAVPAQSRTGACTEDRLRCAGRVGQRAQLLCSERQQREGEHIWTRAWFVSSSEPACVTQHSIWFCSAVHKPVCCHGDGSRHGD